MRTIAGLFAPPRLAGAHLRIALFGAALVGAVFLTPPTTLRAAELVMVEETGCHWCARWNEEIGVVYHKTNEGRLAPLRRVDISDLPKDLKFASRPQYTPTFVLMEDGAELGRIEGHPGEDFFWPLLGRLLDRLPADGGS
ncbi:MAG: hypothetical protein AAF360_02495 [Pseudomonadota bacterium]